MTNFYTGIGSRRTPKDMLDKMENLAMCLAHAGWTLRSGGAQGADQAFEAGCCMGSKEIYIPWAGFAGSDSMLYLGAFNEDIQQRAMNLAEQFHPAWNRCSPAARKMHARNCFQVLGQDLNTPSKFVICWSPGSGGTEQALRIANHFNVPVCNLHSCNASVEEILAEAATYQDNVRTPRVWNKRDPACPKDAVYIGRPSKWGNSYSHMENTLAMFKVNSRDEAVDKYEQALLMAMSQDPSLRQQLRDELGGKDLVCWCKPTRCHGDVLLKYANQ